MMKTMLAARYLGPNQIAAEQVSLPTIGPGEALVQVDACGLLRLGHQHHLGHASARKSAAYRGA